jgi:aromatic-L-amino-acid decarboxylase
MMNNIGDMSTDNQFEEVVNVIMRRISEGPDFPGDETIYRRNSLTLTHNYQLSQLNDFSSINEFEFLPTSRAPEVASTSISLDPTDWQSMRAQAHKMLDVSFDFLQTARDRPVWQPLPTEVRARLLREPVPFHGKPIEEVCEDVLHDVMPYSGGNTHPRFWGWVHGSGTVGGVIAEMLTATMNSNVGLCSHSGVLIERQVIEWMRQLFKFPAETGGGVIVSGTSMAAVVCLAVARYHALNKVRQEGLVALGVQLVAYSSTETHVCVAKALELLGLGIQALRLVPVDEQYRMDVHMLKQMIQEDRQKGFRPFCIVGNAGM